MQAKFLTGSIIIGLPLWYFVMRLCKDIKDWDANLSTIDWANKSISYLFLESHSVNILANEHLRISLACFQQVVHISYTFVIRIPETILLVAGCCWMETVNNFKMYFESDRILITGNKVFISIRHLDDTV